jgi:DNA-binding NarL/FixJ family response regulator
MGRKDGLHSPKTGRSLMPCKRTILYVPDPFGARDFSFFLTLSAAGYDVVTAHSSHQAVLLALNPEIEAAVIHVAAPESGYSVAEKLKFVRPEMRVVLVNTETDSNRDLPPCVDAATYSNLADDAVAAIRTFLD